MKHWSSQLLQNGLNILNNNAKLQILIYHRVIESFDPLQPELVTKDIFEEQIRLLSKFHTILDLHEAIKLLDLNKLPAKSVCITFDDGYRDNHDVALPILKKYNVTATFFISTGFLGGRVMFNDRLLDYIRSYNSHHLDLSDFSLGHYHMDSLSSKYKVFYEILKKLKYLPYPDRVHILEEICDPIDSTLAALMMRPHHIKNLYFNGMQIGAHTVNHPILTAMPLVQAKEEILQSKEELEQILQSKVNYFAYPNGKYQYDFNDDHVSWVKKCGFLGAVSTNWGTVSLNSDRFKLARFTPWDKNPYKFMLRLLQYRYKSETETI